jgi:hypothetical protein
VSIESRFEFDWLAKAFGDLGFLIQSLKGLNKLPPPFFFNLFVAVDEGWWAVERRARGRNEARREASVIHTVITPIGNSQVSCHNMPGLEPHSMSWCGSVVTWRPKETISKKEKEKKIMGPRNTSWTPFGIL